MSKKDYIACAAVVKAVRASGGDEGTCLAFAERMAGVFGSDNPAFKPDVFYGACGYVAHFLSSDNAALTEGGTECFPLPS